jgi:2-polyprenyl-6-methoxyphenol hydroxylase-like FAD-dependent oxidoreductase
MTHVPVLIVGAGPVGLALAIELGWRGIRCLLVEQRDGSINAPKMNLANMRVMEHCRRWGIERQVRDAGWPKDYPLDFMLVTSMAGFLIGQFSHPCDLERRSPVTPSPMQRCPQTWFDPILARLAANYPTVDLRYRWKLETFEDGPGGVACELRDLTGNRRETVTAQYLAGCDGAHSGIREALGIPMQGRPTLDHNMNVFFRAPGFLAAHDKGKAVNYFMMEPQGIGYVMSAVDGRDLWRLGSHVTERDTPENFDAAGAIRTFMGTDLEYEVLSILKWTRSELVAERMRQGRVFLAGDAAHQLTPNGGMGMNTGISDAVDLGWKLAAVFEGWGGRALLDSYDAERLPVARHVVQSATEYFRKLVALPKGPEIADATPAGEALRRSILDTCHRTGAHFLHESEGLQLGFRYDPSPICVADGTPPPPDDVAVYTPSARPGSRAPHGWLADGRSVIDLFGRGFALLRFDRRADAARFAEVAASRDVPLAVHDIDRPEIAALYERRLVLVRPDGHVAWRGDAAPADAGALIDLVRGARAALPSDRLMQQHTRKEERHAR